MWVHLHDASLHLPSPLHGLNHEPHEGLQLQSSSVHTCVVVQKGQQRLRECLRCLRHLRRQLQLDVMQGHGLSQHRRVRHHAQYMASCGRHTWPLSGMPAKRWHMVKACSPRHFRPCSCRFVSTQCRHMLNILARLLSIQGVSQQHLSKGHPWHS